MSEEKRKTAATMPELSVTHIKIMGERGIQNLILLLRFEVWVRGLGSWPGFEVWVRGLGPWSGFVVWV